MTATSPATMISTRVVPARRMRTFRAWADGMERSAAAAAGCGGSLRLEQAGGLVHIVYRFEDDARLDAWIASDDYHALIERGRDFPVERRTTVIGRTAHVIVPAESAASKLKMPLLTWITIFPVLLVVSTIVRALAAGWPQPVQLLVSSVVMVAALSWTIMPWVQRRARPWTLADAEGRARR